MLRRRAGQRRHWVELQSITGRTASGDGYIDTWTTYARSWASVEPATASAVERLTANTQQVPVTHVKYYDTDNVLQTLSSANYYLPAFNEPATLALTTTATIPGVYTREDAWQIEYVVGWASFAAMPANLQMAVQLLVAHWNEHREPLLSGVPTELQFAVTSLCAPYRVWWVPPC